MTQSVDLRREAARSLQQGDVERARQLLTKLAGENPHDWLSLVQLAELQESQRDFEGALRHAREALARNPDEPRLLAKVGLLAQKASQPDVAIGAYERALHLDPKLDSLRFNLANCQFATGQFAEAAATYEAVLEQRPDHAVCRANYAEVLEKLTRYGAAEQQAEMLLQQSPDDPRWLALRGRLALRQQHLDTAGSYLEKALQNAPADVATRLNLASVRFEEQRYDVARGVLESLPEAGRDIPQAARLTFLCQYQEGAVDAALASAQAILSGTNHESAMVVLSLLPQLLRESGRDTEANRLAGLDSLLLHDQLSLSPEQRATLEHTVLQHPSLTFEPATTSTHNGSQTESLLDPSTPEVDHLAGAIIERLRRYVDQQRGDGPYARFLPDQGRLKMWAVALNAGGYQGSHMHPHGVVSGVYYLRIPAGEKPEAGAIEMGRPEPKFALRCEPTTRVVPLATGDLILFPSFLFHRTLPFASPQPRISIAFDLVPPTSPEWQDPGLSPPFSLR